jgi:CubicO group peptidase (beta-lactamase class C family)
LPASDALRGELGLLVRTVQAEERLPSVSAAAFRGDEVVWSEAVGLADAASGEAVTPDHQYRIGSITKTFTAAAILQLRDAGELALDDRLVDHVPESPHDAPTLRRMLSHTSGLQREAPGEMWESLRPPARDELLARLGEAEQILPPGAHWHYSNLAFALLGDVVARRSGLAYEDYVRERLLEPLGMARTTWRGEPPVARGYFVDPYAERVHDEPYDVDLAGTAAAGALWSTTGDLCRWGAFLCDPDPDVLAPETVEEMHAFQAMADPFSWSLGWGLGVALMRRGERIFGGHDGGMPGHVTLLTYARKEKVGSALLIASSAPSQRSFALGLDLTEKAVQALPPVAEPWRPAAAPPAEVAELLGRWWSEGAEFVFAFRDGRLEARSTRVPGERGLAVFEREAPDRYRVARGRERGELLRVVRDGAGEVVKLYWATYAFTRDPRVFGRLDASGSDLTGV